MKTGGSMFLAGLISAAGLAAMPAKADLYTYTFDNLTRGLTTPLLSLAPDSGPSDFTTTFTSSPLTDGFEIQSYNGPAMISGNQLLFNLSYFNTSTPPGNLNLDFSTAITAFSLTIELVAGASGVTVTDNLGASQLFTPSTTDSGIPVILLDFAPGADFSSVNLDFVPTGGALTFLAMDNLQITSVPEPGSWALLLAGLICCWRSGGYLKNKPSV